MSDWKLEISHRLEGLSLVPTREAAIIEELAQHLEDCYAEFVASGATESEAERRTLAELSESELLTRELRWRPAKFKKSVFHDAEIRKQMRLEAAREMEQV